MNVGGLKTLKFYPMNLYDYATLKEELNYLTSQQL